MTASPTGRPTRSPRSSRESRATKIGLWLDQMLADADEALYARKRALYARKRGRRATTRIREPQATPAT